MDWNDIVILVFSGLVAVSTAVYAYLTWRLVGFHPISPRGLLRSGQQSR